MRGQIQTLQPRRGEADRDARSVADITLGQSYLGPTMVFWERPRRRLAVMERWPEAGDAVERVATGKEERSFWLLCSKRSVCDRVSRKQHQ